MINYDINRKVWQILWDYILGNLGLNKLPSKYINETFEYFPYSWEEEENIYHFYHKPSGLKIYWYKYPLRDAKCNIEITDEQFVDVLYDCRNSLSLNQNPRIIYDINKWWDVEENAE